MTDNRLEVLIRESGLEQTKAQKMLELFADAFEFAAKWEVQAKAIVVTDASDVTQMAAARAGRLILKEKRLAIESTRKSMKEQSLREGRAIDGIANVLKALIVPLENYLMEQENFVEIKAKAEAIEHERLALVEAEAAETRAREAREEADRRERERIAAENEELRLKAIRDQKIIDRETALRRQAEIDRKNADRRATYAKTESAKKGEAAEKIITTQKVEIKKIEGESIELAGHLLDSTHRIIRHQYANEALVECPECHHKFIPKVGQPDAS